MRRLITYEQVYEEFIQNGCTLLEGSYKDSLTPMKYQCNCGVISTITRSRLINGGRCKYCGIKKFSKTQSHSHEYVYHYYKINGYILKSLYKGGKYKDDLICPAGHETQMLFNNFKNHGKRCIKCSNVEKYSQEYVDNKFQERGWINKSVYKNVHSKLMVACPNNHTRLISFHNFMDKRRGKGDGCFQCYYNNNTGEQHPNWNPNRDEIKLNKRLRKIFTKKWIIKHMIHDPNYSNFISNPDEYVVDHIIPIKLFCEIAVQYNLKENDLKKLINSNKNLQLLTIKENSKKRDRGSSIIQAQEFLIENGFEMIDN